MVAQEQLRFLEGLVARFERQNSMMVPIEQVQAQYIAIVTMLRGVGHTFRKVDCETPAQGKWADDAWKIWKAEPIFANFIEPTRNVLLKEFHGGLKVGSEAFGSPVISADPGMTGDVTISVDFDAAKLVDDDGQAVMPKIHAGLVFWKRRLAEAQAAFQTLSK